MNTHRISALATLALSLLVACKKPAPSTPQPTPTPTTTPTATSEDAASSAPVPAAIDASAPLPIGTPPIAAPIGEDLIRRLRLTVRASSVTDSSTSADKMLDNDLDTAWNSRTGELVGAWFEVNVPAGVSVASFAMTAGFTRQSGRNDLFLMNHRVERVKVSRDGVELGEFALSPDARTLQTFALSGTGGTYRFTISAERAGTRANWRELCVSEFVLYGTAPEGMAPLGGDGDAGASEAGATDTDAASPATEDAAVSAPAPVANEQPEPLQPSAPETLEAEPMVASVEAFCSAIQRGSFRRAACTAATATLGRSACFCGQMPGPTSPPTFTTRNRQASLQRPASPFVGAYFMARAPNPNDVVTCDLLVRTPAGMFPFIDIADCGPGANTGGNYPALFVRRMRATGGDAGPAELTIEWTETHARPTATRNWACTGSWTARCTVDASNVPACTKEQTAVETCTEIIGTGDGADDGTAAEE